MKISSSSIPQADKLDNVVALIRAVGDGAETDEELIAEIPSLNTDRQGRYYRTTAILLGFIKNNRNHSSLTASGAEFLKAPNVNNPLFVEAVLKVDIIQRLIPFLETKPAGATRQEIINYVRAVSEPVGESMIPRRVSTLLSWLRDLQAVQEKQSLFFLNTGFTEHLPVLPVTDVEQPLFPVTGDLKEYKIIEERAVGASASVAYYKDAAKLERANAGHQRLVNLVAGRIAEAGGIAKSNALIDLATVIEQDYIFEMKSMGENNVRSQIRKGLSQLFEYRYLQNKADAQLVLVMEKSLPKKAQWMIDYLESDRGVHLIWDGDGKLYSTEQTRKALPFLKL